MRPSLLTRSLSLAAVAALAAACSSSSSTPSATSASATTGAAATSAAAVATSAATSATAAATSGPAATAAATSAASASASVAATAAAATSAAATSGTAAVAGGPLTVASAGFTESEVLAYIYSALLDKAGYKVTVKSVANTELFESSLESGSIAVVPEYAATYADFLNTAINGPKAASVASSDLTKTMAALAPLAAKKGVTALTPTKAVDQNAFAVSQSFATANKLKTLTDLGRLGKPISLAAGPECASRPFCSPGLKATYGINVSKIDKLGVDTLVAKQAVENGKDQLVLVLTTDATLAASKLVILTDDKGLQNADYLVPIVNTATLTKHPDIAADLNKLVAVLTTGDLALMDEKVDSDRQRPQDVANAYLKSKGLI